MDKISELPDDLLVKILSYLPTKVAASTMILSKQWQFRWMWLPSLEFGSTFICDPKSDMESDGDSYFKRLQRFLLRNLPLHRAPVIERFVLNLIASDIIIHPEDVQVWVQFSVSRDVRELEISYSSDDGKDILPSSLYTCKFLVTLKLEGDILMEVPRMVCLPSLKTLRLEEMTYDNIDSLQWLLSNCPVLEDLLVSEFDGKMIVVVPSLQRLSLRTIFKVDEFVIDTPSLEYLKLEFQYRGSQGYTSIKNMPKLKEVFVEASFSLFAKLIGSIPSVESLTLCLSFDNISEVVFDDGFVFNKLKYLKLCTCKYYSSNNVLVKLLEVSPNLRVLELFVMEFHLKTYGHYWNQPSSVPECMLTTLERFEWSGYEGSKGERELVIYILQNAPRLKTATILVYEYLKDTLDIKKQFELSSRASTTCQLLFH